MPDRFLREIRSIHQFRKDIRSLLAAKAEEFMKRLGDDAADDWVFRARDAQLPLLDLDWCWLAVDLVKPWIKDGLPRFPPCCG
jgi:hypothetical protein